ncbi:hypothetical protein BGX28_010109 [Mortierella sp. GBA30]|nr:hypothetical protein BGX28_010109 [Mortierella sp. GBA30]
MVPHPGDVHQPISQQQTPRQPRVETSHQNESPRSTQRNQRRREPAAEDTPMPSLDDYEAMLQEMTSPSLGPKGGGSGARAGARRQEREAREPRSDRMTTTTTRQTRRPLLQQTSSGQGHSRGTDAPLDGHAQSRKSDPSFEERKLRRRSSLPSKLKSDLNMFAGLQRRNSGSGHLSPGLVSETPKIHTPTENGSNNNSFAQHHQCHHQDSSTSSQGMTSLQDYAHLPALREKRFSWENESVAPRIDLLEAVQTNVFRNSGQQRKGSWPGNSNKGLVDGIFQLQQQQQHPEFQPQSDLKDSYSASARSSMRLSQQSANKPAVAVKSHLRLSHTPSQPDTESGEGVAPQTSENHAQQQHAHPDQHSHTSLGMVQEEGPTSSTSSSSSPMKEPREEHGAQTPPPPPLTTAPSQPPRPRTPNSRSRPGTPLGGIRPPPGPAPPSASGTSVNSPALVRKLSPSSGKRAVNARPSPPNSSNVMLQPFNQGSRPRAGSAASMNSNGSMNSFALDGVLTPPPPSSPLPSLPPPPLHQTPPPTQPLPPIKEKGTIIGLGIDHHPQQQQLHSTKNRRMSGGGKDLIHPPSQAAAFEGRSSEQMMKLSSRVNPLEKVLIHAEMDTSSRIRDRSELQEMVDGLTEERDLLEKKLALLESKLGGGGGAELSSANHVNHHDTIMAQQEISRLVQLQSSLQQELNEARGEISHLQGMLAETERHRSEEKQTRDGLEAKVEQLILRGDQKEQERKEDHDRAYEELLKEVETLRSERDLQEEKNTFLERELEAFTARLQQEEAQYRTLQDTVQRLSSKLGRMENQHASELDQIQRDNEEVMDKVVYDHANALTDLSEQHKADLEAAVEHARRQSEEAFRQERLQLDAREKVLRDRAEDQIERNNQLEEELFQVQKRIEDTDREKDVLARTSRSLERQLSMQHLKEQENEYKIEELQRENARLRKILSDLDEAVLSTQEGDRDDVEEEDGAQKSSRSQDLFEQQHRKWTEQTELMSRRLARAEEDARKLIEKNVDLKVALELAQTQTQTYTSPSAMMAHLRKSSTSSDSARTLSALSPPLSV